METCYIVTIGGGLGTGIFTCPGRRGILLLAVGNGCGCKRPPEWFLLWYFSFAIFNTSFNGSFGWLALTCETNFCHSVGFRFDVLPFFGGILYSMLRKFYNIVIFSGCFVFGTVQVFFEFVDLNQVIHLVHLLSFQGHN